VPADRRYSIRVRWLSTMFACAAWAQTLDLPKTIQQGRTLRIRGPVGAVAARMGDRTVRLFPQAEGGSFGLMPVPVGQKPGDYAVELLDGPGAAMATATARVVDAHFPKQNVVIERSLAELKPSPGESETTGAFRESVSDVRFWSEPLALPVHGCMTSPFGVQRFLNGKATGDFHGGIDQRSAAGTPIHAVEGGVVKIVREWNLHGRTIGIDHGQVRYCDSSGSQQAYRADRILNATGRVPVVTDLGLEDAGVDFSAIGIPITDRGRTNVPGIWACGDVTGRRMLAHVAMREGIVAVDNMFGRPSRIRYEAMPAVIYTHPEVASAGRTEQELTDAGVAYRKTVVPMGVAGRFLIENEPATGILKLLTGAQYGEILGVHAVGDLSSEFVVVACALIETELPAPQAAEIVFPHPTVAEALREAIRRTGEG